MKKVMKSILITGLILIFPVWALTQTPPHPNGGNNPGSGNTPVGGGAPVGGGLIMLATLAAGYGLRKKIKVNSRKLLR